MSTSNESSAICVCATCGTPMRVVFDEHGKIKRVLAVCKCPRPTVEEANAEHTE